MPKTFLNLKTIIQRTNAVECSGLNSGSRSFLVQNTILDSRQKNDVRKMTQYRLDSIAVSSRN